MLFNSIHFLIFFPIVVGIYFIIPYRFRWILLLAGSYYFYMSWKAEYLILILISTLIDYLSAINIDKTNIVWKRRFFLGLSLFTNLGLLFTFKYLNFVSDSVRQFLNIFSIQFSAPVLNIILPVGISFYTFQTLSYTIDVYNRRIKPERHFGIFAVFVSFFPQLVAGPIERAKNLLPQFRKKNNFNYIRVTNGLKLMLWGLFKKIVIADRLSIVVNTIYSDPTSYTGIPLIMATIFFSFQIYCDFSGYTDIAIGSSQVLGLKLMENFKRPYFSKNVSEFWKRWHISLSTWFENYVFTPLYFSLAKFKRFSKLKTKTRHIIVFGLTLLIGESLLGLWHGADWNFLFFGLYYAVVIFLYHIFRKQWNKIPVFLQIFLNFSIVSIGWIFFRANSLSEAMYIITNLFSGISLNFSSINLGGIGGWTGLTISFISIVFMELVHILQSRIGVRQFLSDKPILLRWSIYLILIFSILLLGVFGNGNNEFIYFQF